MASPRLYSLLKAVAIALGVLVVAWALWEKIIAADPADTAYLDANTLFEDGFYERAARGYEEALAIDPDHIHALRGLARSLHMAGEHDRALALYDEAIARAPEFGAAYANRGILKDTMGRHEAALADYERALARDEALAEGPNWLTRFLRKQAETPPTIATRAAYLRRELAKPPEERVLRVPEEDAQQRPYKQ